jgi:hypothetical protein
MKYYIVLVLFAIMGSCKEQKGEIQKTPTKIDFEVNIATKGKNRYKDFDIFKMKGIDPIHKDSTVYPCALIYENDTTIIIQRAEPLVYLNPEAYPNSREVLITTATLQKHKEYYYRH